MKKLIFLLLHLCFFAGINAQNTISMTGGTRLTMNGNVNLVLGAGKFMNNGILSASTGTLFFGGAINYGGTGTTMVEHLTVAHSSSGVSVLNAPISVINTATLMFGNLDANNNLMIRSDMNDIAKMIVYGAPTGLVNGIVTRATVKNGVCPSFTTTLTLNISGPMLQYQWLSSNDSINWKNIAGANSEKFSPTVTGNTYYRCLVNAINTSFTNDVPGIKLVLDTPRATISGIINLLKGDTSTLTGAAPGGTWQSSNPAITSVDSNGVITGINAGTATITYTVTNSGGCSASAVLVITVINKPQVIITSPTAVCVPATVNLTAPAVTTGSDPNLTYTYYSDAAATTSLATPAAITASGTYYIIGTNSVGVAAGPVPVVVTINTLPSGNITAAQGTILCGAGATVGLGITGGATYTWFKDGVAIAGVTANQLTVTAAGVYTAAITSTEGCRAAAGNNITITQILSPKANFNFDSYCINNPVLFGNISVVTGSGQVSYQWSDNTGKTSTVASPTFTYASTGNVSMKLKVISQTCPVLADSVTKVLAIEQPAAAIRMQTVNVVINEPLDLHARAFGNVYLWSPATGLSNPVLASPKTTLTADQEYKITIKAPSSCITVDTILARIYDNRIYVPNVFTPNGDGINDKLFVNIAGVRQLHYFRVYNRYAKMVFQTTDATIGWDGKFNNTLQPMDTYIWVAAVLDNFGAITIRKGSVTLLR